MRDTSRFDHLPFEELIRRKASDDDAAVEWHDTLKGIREAPLIQDFRRKPPRPSFD